jgi:glyoxylase-like metal-dependent hydrolase (beta-lactamase superfamily II)
MPLLLHAGNASEWTGPTGNNTWLLRGRVPTLIDAGVGNPAHLDALERALDGMPLALVLVTHEHVDHLSGAPALLDRWPSARIRRFGGENGLVDGERIDAGEGTLRVLHTPGHSPDHCCFVAEERAEIFCGDLARAGGTVVIPASKGGSLAQYLESLRRVRALRPAKLLPGHGPAIDSPDALIDAYIQHRAERDREILEAVAAGCRTPRDIAQRVYQGLPAGLRKAAEDTVLAHLIKLRDERRLAEDVRHNS